MEKLIIYLIKRVYFYWRTPAGFISVPAACALVPERAVLSAGIDVGLCGKVRKVNSYESTFLKKKMYISLSLPIQM